MEDLLCLEEGTVVRRATKDVTILRDERVLENLLASEDRDNHRSAPLAYFKFQNEIQPFMRKVVTTWMLEVCEEQQREDEVFPLAVSYLDRVLAATQVKKTRLQLVATACLFIASKMKETSPMDGNKLVMYTDYSITLSELLDIELLVLTVLRWDTSCITAHDFLPLLLARLLSVDEEHHRAVMRHSSTFVALSTIDLNLAGVCPSLLAASCLVASVKGLVTGPTSHQDELIERLQQITRIDTEYIVGCVSQIELILANNFMQQQSVSEQSSNQVSATSSSTTPTTTPTNQKPLDTNQPTTPTDIREIIVIS